MDADQAGAAFVAGSLDAAVTWEPWLSKATSEKNAHILVSTKTLPGVILDVLLVRNETIAKHPDAVESFVRGYYEALKAYNADKKSAEGIMAQALSLKTDEFAAMTGGFRFIPADEAKEHLAPDGGVQKLFQSAADIWVEAKVIDKTVTSQDRVTNRFVEAVLKK